MVPMESRLSLPTMNLGRKYDTWGLRKSPGRGSVMEHLLGKSQMTFFLWEYSASWIRKQSHSLRVCLTIHGATHLFLHLFDT